MSIVRDGDRKFNDFQFIHRMDENVWVPNRLTDRGLSVSHLQLTH